MNFLDPFEIEDKNTVLNVSSGCLAPKYIETEFLTGERIVHVEKGYFIQHKLEQN